MPATRTPRRMRRLAAVVAAGAVLGSLAVASQAQAARVVVRDDQGRAIHFDVQAPGVDVQRYASILRRAIHGNEITRVYIKITTPYGVSRSCGDDAEACYGSEPGQPGPTIVIPNRGLSSLAHTLLHEYGHHVQHTHRTPRWRSARRIAHRLRINQVANDYRNGWDHAVGEIFAEDYVQLHIRADYAIDWLGAPGPSVKAALRRDLAGLTRPPAAPPVTPPVTPPPAPPVSPPATPETPPVTPDPGTPLSRTFTDFGILGTGETGGSDFGLLGPARRVQATVAVTGLRGPARALVAVTCDGTVVSQAEASPGAPAVIDRPGLGPASCRIEVTALDGPVVYETVLTLSVPG